MRGLQRALLSGTRRASTSSGELISECRKGPVTLVFGAKDTDRNQAVALKTYLEKREKLK